MMHAIESSVREHNLLQRWPDLRLSKSFRELLMIYHKLLQGNSSRSGDPMLSIRRGYETLSRWMKESLIEPEVADRAEVAHLPDRLAVHSRIQELKATYGADYLQCVASLLGMLMHFSGSKQGIKLMVNHRRPQKPFSTYPTSPAVAKLVGDAVISHLQKRPIPAICHGFSSAERYAERALAFQVLDPSMESGQLLLEVACASIRQVLDKHSSNTRSAAYLSRALLEKLCRDCLWGIDRNELAAIAVTALFHLLGAEHGITGLVPSHLVTGDALDGSAGRFPRFDVIVNNPPWGEHLTSQEKQQLRDRFSCLKHHPDTYVAFTELAIDRLKPDGVYALILPSQALAANNTSRLRELLLAKSEIEEIVVLPRSAFANATVRGVVLLGRARPTARASANCRATVFPIVKRMTALGSPRHFKIPMAALHKAGQSSWWTLLNGDSRTSPTADTVALGQVAVVTSGVHLYKKGKGIPRQTAAVVKNKPFTFGKPQSGTVPAVRGRDVHQFCVSEPKQFIKFGKWLANIGNHRELRASTRIFVRELCSRDGSLSAAVARDGFIPVHGVLAVIPKMIDAHVLVGLLNSQIANEYVGGHTASFSKVDFQKVTIGELRRMPIAVAALDPEQRRILGLPRETRREASLRNKLSNLSQQLSRMPRINEDTGEIRARINRVVLAMYGLAEEEK